MIPLQSLEAYNTKPINGLVESRKHTREGGLEKEEEDYFNADRFVSCNFVNYRVFFL